MHTNLPPKPMGYRSRNLNRRRSCYRHISQAIDILGCVLPSKRRKCDPCHSLWYHALDSALLINSSRLIVDHVRLVDPANEQLLTQILLSYSLGIKAERDWSTAPSCLASHFGLQGWDDRERGHLAGTFDDEWRGKVEGVNARYASIKWRWVGYVANGVLAEEGVVAGFDREDGGGTLNHLRICESETRNNVDDSADTDGGNDIGQSKELIRAVDWKRVFTRRKSARVVHFQYILGGLHVEDLLRLHAPHDVDGVIVLLVGIPSCEVLYPFTEEC